MGDFFGGIFDPDGGIDTDRSENRSPDRDPWREENPDTPETPPDEFDSLGAWDEEEY